ncbi:hypothetical protein [Phenylobacterium sp.]|uniref:hypothetical protein n=1 Tax=Phenylobacterium sp. TaxID=1871053 RepID=UPI002811D85A|nr:hypothetical protein [Phenylobacterium sp.]
MSAGEAPLTASSLLPLLSLGLAILIQTAVVAFFGGKLSQRMTSAEKRLAEQDTKIEAKIGDQSLLVEKVVRLQVQMEHVIGTVDRVGHTLEGVNRQLGNIAMNRIGQGVELSGGKS